MEYHYFGLYEHWEASILLLEETLGGQFKLPHVPSEEEALAVELPSQEAVNVFRALQRDPFARKKVLAKIPTDAVLYRAAEEQFIQRCKFFGIKVPSM